MSISDPTWLKGQWGPKGNDQGDLIINRPIDPKENPYSGGGLYASSYSKHYTENEIGWQTNSNSELIEQSKNLQDYISLPPDVLQVLNAEGISNQQILNQSYSVNAWFSMYSYGDFTSDPQFTGYQIEIDGVSHWLDAKTPNSNLSGMKAELQILGKASTRYLYAAKGLSKGAGILGVLFTGVDAYQKGEWQNHHTADVLIGLGTTFMLTGPWGWAAAGAYFLLDMGVKSYSGKSISENLFDGP